MRAQPECASRAKTIDRRERVFFHPSQALEASSKNGLTYDGWSSGSIIYAYVGGNPLRDADPEGLQGATTVDSWCTQNPVVCAEINGPKSVPNPSKILPITQELTKDRCPPGDPDGKDPCKGLRKQLELHEQKLRDYVNNPLKYDNRGDLSNALLGNNAAQANRIYEGRLKELRSQIESWKREIQKCEEKNGR